MIKLKNPCTYEIRDTELIRWKGGEETIYKNDEIEKIIVYLSPALYKNSNCKA